jgi:O-antigen/teichoic acid export membrane protein
VSALALFGDFGLAPSLIQRKEELEDREIRVAFTCQQILVIVIVVVILATAPFLAKLYPSAPPNLVWLVRAVAFSLFLTSWRTISAIQLERKLMYDRLAPIEIAEQLSFQMIAVAMALTGHGVWSYVVAMLASGALGAVLVYWAAPWKIGLEFDYPIFVSLFKFGAMFQLGSIVNSLGGAITPLIVGTQIGSVGVGYLTWASSLGRKPYMLVDSIMRVGYSHFSRLQEKMESVVSTVLRYITITTLVSGLWFSVFAAAGYPMIELVYSSKWTPAVLALILYAFSIILDSAASIIGISVSAMGRPSAATRMVAIRTLFNFALTYLLVKRFGFIGAAYAYVATSILSIALAAQIFDPIYAKRILSSLGAILVPTLAASCFGCILARLPTGSLIISAAISVAGVTAVYAAVAWLVAPPWIKISFLEKSTALLRPLKIAIKPIRRG